MWLSGVCGHSLSDSYVCCCFLHSSGASSLCHMELGAGAKISCTFFIISSLFAPISLLFPFFLFLPASLSGTQSFRNSEKEALEKGYLHKIVRIDFQICDNFAHPSSDARSGNTGNLAQIWRATCDKFAQPPFANAPFSGSLKLEIILFRLVAHLFSRLSCPRLRGSLPRYSEGVEHT